MTRPTETPPFGDCEAVVPRSAQVERDGSRDEQSPTPEDLETILATRHLEAMNP